jgi:hypothetical protein
LSPEIGAYASRSTKEAVSGPLNATNVDLDDMGPGIAGKPGALPESPVIALVLLTLSGTEQVHNER